MKQLTKEELEKAGFQDKIQFGTRVEAQGEKGIVNFFSNTLCRVYYGVGKYLEVSPYNCRILSSTEAVGV